jgi:cation diffusion facilitator family transporter
MLRRQQRLDPVREKKERAVYALLYFFISSFLCKVAFGAISGSKTLMVSGIFALFGVFVAVVTLLRIHVLFDEGDPVKHKFSYEKLEFFIIAGISLIIVVSTGIILFSVIHVIFFHTLYPPGFSAAWVAAIIAAVNIWIIKMMKERVLDLEEAEGNRIMFLVNKDFLLSILVIVTVVITRFGYFALDYLVAIIEAVLIISYSVYFLFNSFKGLMDAACDKKTLDTVKKSVKKADPSIRVRNIKINPVGKMLDIVVMINLAKSTKGKEAHKVAEKIRRALKANLDEVHEVQVGVVSG